MATFPGGIRDVPEVNLLARLMGDWSGLVKTGGVPVQRGVNRAMGRASGKVFGFVNARFGVFGMIALAQFLATLRAALALQAVDEDGGRVYIGSAVNYAKTYHNGTAKQEARPYLKQAFQQVPFKEQRVRVPNTLRGGLYHGQRFVDDFAAFGRGDIARFARRSAGRQIAGFTWGNIRLGAETKRPNILANYLRRVAIQAKKNVKEMGEDTGTLRASIAWGLSMEEMAEKSRKQAMSRLGKVGKAGEINRRINFGQIRENSPAELGIPSNITS